ASFSAHMPAAGNLALISQSGAIAAGMVDWAAQRAVGFSGIVSIGDQLDVDIADLLDYFALDERTHAILLYIEAIKDARKFMAAASACWRLTGWSNSAAFPPTSRLRPARSSMRCCLRHGRNRTRSISLATPIPRAMPRRSKRCSPTRAMTPCW